MPVSAWLRAALALERERPGHDADGQRAELARDGRDDGRAAGAGATALARGDEHHVGAAQQLLDVVLGVLGGLAPHLGVGAGAESAGGVTPDVELDVGIAHQQRLGVGVDGDELHALQALFDHPVDGIHAAATDADHLDDGEIVVRGRHRVAIPPLLLRGAGPLVKPSTSTIGLELCQVVPCKQNGRATARRNRAGAPTISGHFLRVRANDASLDGRQIRTRHVVGVAGLGQQGSELERLLLGAVGGPPDHLAAVDQRQRDRRDRRRRDAPHLPRHLGPQREEHLQGGLRRRHRWDRGCRRRGTAGPGGGGAVAKSTPSRSNRCGPSG